jgi:purine-cytosine permease-like protein
MVMELMVGLRLVLPALIIVLFSTFTTTFLDIYSTAVSSMNIWPHMREGRGIIACGVMGTIIALIFPATAYEGFLLTIGSVFCPLFGVVLADYFFFRKGRYLAEGLYRQDNSYWYLGGFNPWAFVAWGMGFVLYHILQKGTAMGSSIPSLLAAGIIYLILMRFLGLLPQGAGEGIDVEPS